MPLSIAVTRERTPGEHRVALVPETARKYRALGATLRMERTGNVEGMEHAIKEYGSAIRELAQANIFPGDMLWKNCLLYTSDAADE